MVVVIVLAVDMDVDDIFVIVDVVVVRGGGDVSVVVALVAGDDGVAVVIVSGIFGVRMRNFNSRERVTRKTVKTIKEMHMIFAQR